MDRTDDLIAAAAQGATPDARAWLAGAGTLYRQAGIETGIEECARHPVRLE